LFNPQIPPRIKILSASFLCTAQVLSARAQSVSGQTEKRGHHATDLLSGAHYAAQHISNMPSVMLKVPFLEGWGKCKHAIKFS